MNFPLYNLEFKQGAEDWIVARGEIRNDTSKEYHEIIFRLVLFDKTRTIGFGMIKLTELRRGSTRYFEILIDGVSYRMIPNIVRWELVMESGR